MKKITILIVLLVLPLLAVGLSWDSGAACDVHPMVDIYAYVVKFDEEKTGGLEGHVSEVQAFFCPPQMWFIPTNSVLFFADDAGQPGMLLAIRPWDNREEGWQSLAVDIDVPPVFYVSIDRNYYENDVEWGVAFDDDGGTGHSWLEFSSGWREYPYDLMIRCEWEPLRD
ncbi:hypothetical protein KAU45_11450 [bacterium]|nr:hypothetical protein [bacterium]